MYATVSEKPSMISTGFWGKWPTEILPWTYPKTNPIILVISKSWLKVLRVSASAQALSQGTMLQKESINGIVSNVTDITAQIQNSAVRCGNASDLVTQATGYAAEADTKVGRLITATRNIDKSPARLSVSLKPSKISLFRQTSFP